MRSTLVFIFILLFGSTTNAAGLFVPDVGTRGLTRAGAMVASGDDLSALWYNPANLAGPRGWRLQVDLTLVSRHVFWQRMQDPAVSARGFPAVDNRLALPVPIPGLWASSDFGVPGLAVALAVYAPYNAGLSFPADGPQRYSVIKSGSFVIFFHGAIAYQIFPWLKVGAGFFANSVFFIQKMAVNLGLGRPEDPDYDAVLDIYGQQHLLVNGNFGITLSPGWGFELGASLVPRRRASATGTADPTLPPDLAELITVHGSRARFELEFPFIVRGGVAWRYRDLLTVEADLVFEGWSSLKAIKIFPENIMLNIGAREVPIPDLAIERGWLDTVSVRVGGEFLVYRPLGLKVRAGYYYEPGAVPNHLLSVGSTDSEKHGVSLGLAARFGKVEVSAGYARALYPVKRVTNSRMRLTNPIQPEAAPVIGNGRYHFGYDLYSASVAVDF